MNIDNLNDLPNWDDFKNFHDEEGEEWKPKPTREACKKLYMKWNEIIVMLKGAINKDLKDNDNNEFALSNVSMIMGDAYQVAVKVKSSEVMDMYVGRMENAAIIRKNAQFIQTSILLFPEDGLMEEKYCDIIRDEIDVFKELFKEWVGTFEKDEYEDEWGLFV